MGQISKDTRDTFVAGIMAAGSGQRILSISKSKPLTLIGGIPLIEHVIRQCLQAGIIELVVAIRPNDSEVGDLLKKENRFPLGVKIVYVTNDSGTGGALRALTKKIGNRHCLISTVDTIAPVGTYFRFINYVKNTPLEVSSVILVTSFVQDEDPIWIIKDKNNHIHKMEKKINPTGIVFGNVRWLSASVTKFISQSFFKEGNRDMFIMTEIIKNPDTVVVAFQEDPIFDIDDPNDVESASKWLSKFNSNF